MIKIAIYHNLNNGGALTVTKNLVKQLRKINIKVDIYSNSKITIPYANKIYYYPINPHKGLINELLFTVFKLPKIQKNISSDILEKKYNKIIVFPCYLTQSPFILRYISKNCIYMFQETKREFYENTSFNHNSIKKIITRLIRYPLKIIDRKNCRKAEHIIVNSYYSQFILKKYYSKKSYVLYPGIKQVTNKLITTRQHKSLSLGLLTYLKGHHISSYLNNKTDIYGQVSNENIIRHIRKQKVHSNMDINPEKIYKSYNIFMANQIYEPFGLTTVEACNNELFVIGSNTGGTCEIIESNVNGILLPISNLKLSRKITHQIMKKKKIQYWKNCVIDWNHTSTNLLKILINE
ncbi:MAG TPA: glycosyltransferase [Ignavibacteria bacterium]